MTDLCDKVYAEDGNTKSRAAHHIEAIALTYRLLPQDEHTDNEEEAEIPHQDIGLQISEPDAALHFADTLHVSPTDMGPLIDFSADTNEILDNDILEDFLCVPFSPSSV